MKTIKLYFHQDLPENYTGIAEWDDGCRIYYLNSKPHNAYGPAVVWPDGSHKEWYLDGKCIPYKRWLKKRTKYITTVSKLLMGKRIGK